MKLILSQAWKLCLECWRDIVPKWLNSGKDINELKRKWVREHGHTDIELDCFFCEYSKQNGSGCGNCPGQLIDPDFSCGNFSYHYLHHPVEFLAELERLNKIRLESKE